MIADRDEVTVRRLVAVTEEVAALLPQGGSCDTTYFFRRLE